VVPVHEPDVDLPGGAVLPQDIGLAIVIEIANAGNIPVQGDVRAPAAGKRGAVHQPDEDFAGGAVAPQDVTLASPVRNRHALNEHRVREWERRGLPLLVNVVPFMSQK